MKIHSPQKIAMVTGSSSGIGQAIAFRLAQSGWFVILHGRTISESLLETKLKIEQCGGQTGLVVADFSETQLLERFVNEAWSVGGRIDAWINNAGGDVLTGTWSQRTLPEKLDYLLKVDVTATLLLSRMIGEKMKAAFKTGDAQSDGSPPLDTPGRVSILNMGWDQAVQGMGGESGELFATTKGAIMAMSKSLAQSLSPAVRVNCLAPGWIQTDWGREASAYWNERAKRESLMDRWGRPEDVAEAACFLCGETAQYISGQVLSVNGGFRYSTD
jgi:3-oxoacyl-[acyl-carrier protein] reductase